MNRSKHNRWLILLAGSIVSLLALGCGDGILLDEGSDASAPDLRTAQLDQGGGGSNNPPLIWKSMDPIHRIEQWRSLVEKYFEPENIPWAMAIMKCESGGDPKARNSQSGAQG